MGTVTTSGIGSGIDIEGLVTRLVQAEGTPKQARLATREAQLQAQLSAFGAFRSAVEQLRSAVTALKSAATFQARSVSVGEPKTYTATAGATAAAGSYQIEVVRLATGSKLASQPHGNADAVVGTGTLRLASGAASFTVEITEANRTLAGIRDAINAGAGASGVSATVVTANDGARLVINGAQTGVANELRVTQSGGDGGLAALVYDPAGATTNLQLLQAGTDARIRIDGFEYDSPSNTVTGALTGITLNLAKASEAGTSTSLTVAADAAGGTAAINGLAGAYNRLLGTLRPLGAFNAETQQGGALLGDSTLRDFLANVRRLLGSPGAGLAGNGVTALSEIGITTNLDGTLKVDSAKLNSAFARDATAVQTLFTSPTAGFGMRLDGLLEGYVRGGGALEARTDGLRETIRDIGRQREALNARLVAYESRLRGQFIAMDTLVAQLRQTGNNLTAALDQLQPQRSN